MPSIGCDDGNHGTDAAAMMYELMQMCDLGMGRRPVQTLQAHARVSPPCTCIFKSCKGTNIHCIDLHRGDHHWAGMMLQELGRRGVERERRLLLAVER